MDAEEIILILLVLVAGAMWLAVMQHPNARNVRRALLATLAVL